MNTSKVWYVTGASQGLGLSLVKKLLASGYRVAATSRNVQQLKQATGIIDSERFLPLAVDVNSTDSVEASIRQTMELFGQIDVLVNNAGYGMSGTAEETKEEDIRKIFDVNVLAPINITRAVLPVMRRQGAGYIINIGSVAGFVGAPGWSVYSATKAALAAFTEVLALDLEEFGIKVTVAEPSGLRTGFLTKDSLAYTKSNIEGYKAVKETAARYLSADGRQPGDPERAAGIFISLAETSNPPVHLYMGQDAYNRASQKLKDMTQEMEQWKKETIASDYNAING